MKRDKRINRGFTLTELIIVIVIIGVLAAIIVPSLFLYVARANYTSDLATAKNMTQVVSASEISSQEELDEELTKAFGDVFLRTIAPKSTKKGYHYWYGIEEKEVLLAKTNELEASDEYYSNPSPRSRIVNGYILLDRVGSDIAKFVTGLEMVCSKTECDEILKYGLSLAEDEYEESGIDSLYSFLSSITIINSNGSVRFNNADRVSRIYFPNKFASLQSTNIFLFDEEIGKFNSYKLSEYNPLVGYGMFGAKIEIPSTMYLGTYSFFVDPDAEITLVFDVDDVSELNTILAADATNAKIALKKNSDKKYYISKNCIRDVDTDIEVVDNLVYTISKDVLNYTLPSIQEAEKAVTVSTNLFNKTKDETTISTDSGISAIIPKGVKTTSDELKLKVTPLNATESNLIITGSATSSVDIHVDGISKNNEVPIVVSLGRALPINLIQSSLKMYHIENDNPTLMTRVFNIEELNTHNTYYYDSNTGEVIVALKSFSEVFLLVDPSQIWTNEDIDTNWYNETDMEFYISTAAQLAGLSKLVNDGTDSFEGKKIILENDIVINDWNIYGHGDYLKDENGKPYTKENPHKMLPSEIAKNNDVIWYDRCDGTTPNRETDYYPYYFTPIGNSTHPFMGNFDGQGNTIYGFFDIDCWHDWHSVGLFGYVYGTSSNPVTIENINIDECFVYSEYCRIGLVACNATGNCTFQNIACHNNHVSSYNEYVGGIIANYWYVKFKGNTASNCVLTMTNCVVDNTNTLSALWGTYDCCLGGLIGGLDDDGSKVYFNDCVVYCTLDAYNDCCANYQWFQYRYCGMLIGWAPFSDVSTLKDDIIFCDNCTVALGEWNQYYYYKWPLNGKPSYASEHDWKYSRYSEANLIKEDGVVTGGYVYYNDEKMTIDDAYEALYGQTINSRGNDYILTNDDFDRLCHIPLTQLFGSGNGRGTVGRYGVDEDQIEGVTIANYEDLVNTGVETITTGSIIKKWTNPNFIYRVGNQEAVKLDSLFSHVVGTPAITSSDVNITWETIDNATATFTKNNSDWTQGTIKFNDTGIIKVVLSYYNKKLQYILEVVDGVNATTAVNATSKNVVLLNDVSGTFSVTGRTFYGNGFTVTASGTGQAKTFAESMITVENGIIDNVIINFSIFPNGYLYSNELSNYGKEYYDYMRTGVRLKGNSKLLNSYVKGARAAVHIAEGKDVEISNCTLYGGTLCNLLISTITGELVLENLTTIQVPTKSTYQLNGTYPDVLGMGICCDNSDNPKIVLRGDLRQYNWVSSQDSAYVPSNYRSAVSVALGKEKFVHVVNGTNYVNLGMIFFNGNELCITDERSNKDSISYSSSQVSILGATGTVYSYNNSKGYVSSSRFDSSNYSYEPNKQCIYEATKTFDHSINYISNTNNDDNYCYFDEANNKVRISLKQINNDDTFEYDPMILTISKYGHLVNYLVKMNEVNYNDNIVFDETGESTIKYSFTDDYNYRIIYDDNKKCYILEQYSINYTIDLDITVIIVEPDAIVYHPEFSYVSSWSNSAKSIVIGTDTYIMPDVSSTSSTIGSTTVSGQTIYYPIVSVAGKNSSGNSYSSGKIYCFAPAFSAINIRDLDVNTGATLYTYNSSSQKWPHNITAATGPGNSSYYGPASTRDPYGAGTGATYEKYAFNSNNGGLCYTSNEIERNITANTKLVKFHYVGNDDITYYYYIQYKYEAVTYSSGGGTCLLPNSLVTLADGTQKFAKDITINDELLTFNHITGQFESQKIIFNVYVEESEFYIITLEFTDGYKLELASGHGLFNLTNNSYEIYYDYEFFDHIGEEFVVVKYVDGAFVTDSATLLNVDVQLGLTEKYSPLTEYNVNCIANGLLTIPDDIEGMLDSFTYKENMMIDLDILQEDIETYGVYSYDDVCNVVPKYIFDMFNFKYWKVFVSKGTLSYDKINYWITKYVPSILETQNITCFDWNNREYLSESN